MADAANANAVRHRDTRLRFEQWARNPACQANTLSAVHGIPMSQVAKREGTTPTMGQSPFAIARGEMFERSLFRNDAAVLREALVEADVLPKSAKAFTDFRLKLHGGQLRSHDDARAATTRFFHNLAKGKAAAGLAAAPTLLIPGGVMLPEAILVIDALVATRVADQVMLTVGEIKTYPDRGGHTDGAELATARAQAGVYVHGLQVVLRELGLDGHVTVALQGFLVLSRPGFNRPSIRAGEDLCYQAKRAERGFSQLETAASGLPAPGRADPEMAIMHAGTAYESTCVSFCDRAATCFQRALVANDPIILGEDVRRLLGQVPLDRAVALLNGEKPKTDAERALNDQFQQGD